jgi:putative ABC transport system permease protein
MRFMESTKLHRKSGMWDRSSLEILWQDIRQAVRTLRNDPGFTLVALTALTIGIGANTSIFSVVDKVLLQPLPYRDPASIVQLGRKFPDGVSYTASIPKYMVWRDNDVFSSMALYDLEGPGFNIDTGDFPEQVKGAHVSADYFTVFGVPPVIGRAFNQAEDLPNGPKAVLISENLWRSLFGSDAQILTRTINLNSVPYPVVGVIPSRFAAKPDAEVWIPLQADPHSVNQGHYLQVAARLRPGVSISQAQAEMLAAGERFRHLYPTYMDKTESVEVIPMRESIVGDIRKTLYVLLGAVAFVLLIACANVANLLLARSGGRHRELAIRAALGASRFRVIRQLLTENVLLSTVGGFLGLILGVLGVRMLLLLIPGDIPRVDPAQLRNPFDFLDWRILVFTIGVSLLTGILFGLIPALQISKPDVASTLNAAGTRSSTSRHQRFTSKTLVAVEMGLALMLLISAALLIRTFAGLSSVESGFDSHHVYTMLTSLANDRYQTTEATTRLTRQALQNIESIAAVESASTSLVIPATSAVGQLAFDIPGKANPSGQEHYGPEQWRSVSPHFFKVFRIPLLSGRVFTDHDDIGGAPIVIVSAAFARKYFANENPIGRTLDIGKGIGPTYADYARREIVGVVGDTCETGLIGGKIPVMYIPQAQQPQGMTKIFNSSVPLAWEVRSSLDEKSLISAVAKAIRAVDGRLPLGEVRPMDKILADSISRQNFNMLLLSIFATSALLLAAIGIYGVMSYSVQQQTKEIGVRMALGADKNTILAMILRQGLTPAFIGVAAGLAGAFGLTRLMESLLYGVKPGDPISFFGVAAILFMVALLAVLIPARRAISLDPVAALRSD